MADKRKMDTERHIINILIAWLNTSRGCELREATRKVIRKTIAGGIPKMSQEDYSQLTLLFGESLKKFVYTEIFAECGEMYFDIVGSALHEVDWGAIADKYLKKEMQFLQRGCD